jgi:hypothetical protein
MMILFLLDSNEYVAVDPTKLQLRQIAPGQSALGVEFQAPLETKDGEEAKFETRFRPFINYAVNLTIPAGEKPPVADSNSPDGTVPSETVAKNVAEVKRRSRKKSMKVPA